MADETKEVKKTDKSESLCPPFLILHGCIVLGETEYRPGEEAKLRAVLDQTNFESLILLGAIAKN